MVLHKNKWDHKAKIAYLKKHGLTRPKQQPQITPKWSSKKSSNSSKFVYEDNSDSEWDSEDEALLNHFYPEIAEQNISDEQKFKIKKQIVNGLREKAEKEESERTENEGGESAGIDLSGNPDNFSDGEDNLDAESEMGGIYLGTEPEEEIQLPDLELRLSDFVISDLNKAKLRKLLKNKISDTLLEDYGIASYKDTVKSTDYNDVKRKTLDVNEISLENLQGFKIGQKKEDDGVRSLTSEELQEHAERSKKLESAKLYEAIKKKFGEAETQRRVIEINNFNENDERLVKVLNLKLSKDETKFLLDDDLDLLLGSSAKSESLQPQGNVGLDDLLELAKGGNNNTGDSEAGKKVSVKISKGDEEFLDDLLG